MGSGASSGLEAAIQAATVDDLKAALSQMPDADLKKIKAALVESSATSAWQNRYIGVVFAGLKDVDAALPLVYDYKGGEVMTGLVPRCGVLGKATKLFPEAVEKDMKDKAVWFQMYNDLASAMNEKLTSKHTDWVLNDIINHCINDDYNSLEAPYIGACYYLEKPGSATGDNFVLYVSFKCKDAACAQKALGMLKAHGSETLSKEEGAICMIVVPPSAVDSMVPETKDDVEVKFFKVFKNSSDWDKHQETAYYKDLGIAELVNDRGKDIAVHLFANAKSFVAPFSISSWDTRFIAMVFAGLKDVAAALPLVYEYKAGEVKTGLVPCCGVLGKATKLFPEAVEKDMKEKAVWFQMYNDQAAAMDEKLTSKHTDWVLNDFIKHCINDDYNSMEAPYIGICYHLQKPDAGAGDHFWVYASFKCKDAACAQKALDMLKAHGCETLSKEDGALRMIVLPPSAVNSLAPETKDDVEVKFFKEFKSSSDWDKHQETAHYKDLKIAELVNDHGKDIAVLWFADAKTFAP